MAMIQKNVTEKIFLSAKTTLTIPEIPSFAEGTMCQLFAEIENLNLTVTGPCEFIYFGCTGDMAESFDLIIGVPIEAKKEDSELFEYYVSPAYTCVSKDYSGDLKGLGDAWCSFCKEAEEKGFTFSPENQAREIYKKWDTPESLDNITELQIKLK